MNERKRRLQFKTLAFLLLSLALLATPAFGFGLSPASAAPTVDDVVMTKALSQDQQPLEPTLVFDQTDTFYASVKVSDLQAGSQVAARWYWGDQKLDEYTIAVSSGGSGYLGFNLTSQSGTWPVGAYSVEVYLNNALARTAPFAVRPPAGAIPSRVKSATMTLGVDGAGKATQPALVFAPSDVIHASVNADLGLGSQLVARWYAEGQPLEEYTVTITAQENKPNTYVDMALRPVSPLAPGSYSVEISLDGKLARAMDFIVQQGSSAVGALATPGRAAAVMPQQPSIGPIRFSTDPGGQQALAAFPAGTRAIYATFDYQGFPTGSTFEQIWYLDGLETGRGSFTWNEAESGSYQGSLANDQGLLSGTYKLEIRLDGQLLGSGQFVIGQVSASVVGTPAALATLIVVPVQPEATAQSGSGSGTFFGDKPTPGLPLLPQQPAIPVIGPIRFENEASGGFPAAVFPLGTATVYADFEYQGFAPGANFEQIWFLEGQETGRGSFAWNEAESGSYQTSLANDQGLLPGNYSLEIKLDGQLLGQGSFMVGAAVQPTAQVQPQPTIIIQPIATPAVQPPPAATVIIRPPTPKPKASTGAGKLVFSIYNGSVHSLWTMNLNGSDRKLLTDQASDPSFSPDGQSVAFFAWDGSPHGASGVYQNRHRRHHCKADLEPGARRVRRLVQGGQIHRHEHD